MTLCLLALSVHFFTEFMDDDHSTLTPVFVPILLALLLHIAISFKEVVLSSSWVASGMSLITPALSTCTVSGACSSFYISTLSSFFSAFGISVIDMSSFLAPLTGFLLSITLYSIYYTRKTILFAPFWLATFSSALIIFTQLNHEWEFPLLYIGNLLIIVSVVWNNRLIKVENHQVPI
jgi:hypothetical protein